MCSQGMLTVRNAAIDNRASKSFGKRRAVHVRCDKKRRKAVIPAAWTETSWVDKVELAAAMRDVIVVHGSGIESDGDGDGDLHSHGDPLTNPPRVRVLVIGMLRAICAPCSTPVSRTISRRRTGKRGRNNSREKRRTGTRRTRRSSRRIETKTRNTLNTTICTSK